MRASERRKLRAKDLGAIADPCNASHSVADVSFFSVARGVAPGDATTGAGASNELQDVSGTDAPKVRVAGLFLEFLEQGNFVLLPQLTFCTTQPGD